MAKARKTWAEKLAEDRDLPKVVHLKGAAAARWGGRTMIIPAPRQVDALIRRIRKGRVATVNDLRSALARAHGTEIACPITTGIFSWMAAQAAEEAAAAGRARVTPWWRVLKGEGELNPRFPGGAPEQASRLRSEGHQVIRAPRGSKLVVQDIDRVRAKLG